MRIPTINKSVYFGSIEFWSFGTDEFFEGILSYWLIVEDHLLRKIIKMHEKVVDRQCNPITKLDEIIS